MWKYITLISKYITLVNVAFEGQVKEENLLKDFEGYTLRK